jgi:hypothetical protein
MRCAPSAQLEQQFPNESSPYAEEGTLAHEFAALQVRQYTTDLHAIPYQRELNELKRRQHYSDEMITHADAYADYILNTLMEPDTRAVLIEQPIDLTSIIPDGRGTADCIIDNGDSLHVVDFKYGRGVRVEADENEQMKLYAFGALQVVEEPSTPRLQQIHMHIVQPRLSSKPSTFSLRRAELLDWAFDIVRPQAQAAASGDGAFVPGDKQCRFCRAKPRCKAMVDEVFKDIETIKTTSSDTLQTITVDEVGELLLHYSLVKDWFSAAEEIVKRSLIAGQPVKGWKMVEGRSTRRVIDGPGAAQRLQQAGYTLQQVTKNELLGITDLTKLVGKGKLDQLLGDLIQRPAGAPTLAPATDPRPEFDSRQALLDQFDSVKKVNY